MKKLWLVYASFFSLLFAINGYAGTDPIAWSAFPAAGFPAQTNVGSSYSVSYTLSNNLPFPVAVSVSAAHNGGTFGLTNGCNTTLAGKNRAGSSCLVHVFFQPVRAGMNNVQLTVAYNNNRVPLPRLSSTAVGGGSGPTSDKVAGFVTTPLPAVTYIGATYNVGFTFVNNGHSVVTASAVNVQGFTASGNTCTTALNPNSTCGVTGTFTPTTVGQANLGVTFVYSNGSVPLITQSNVQNSTGACHQVNGFASLPLPVSTFIYADNVVKFQFTNHCPSTSETLGTVSLFADMPSATITKGTDTCSGQTLAANGSCSILASVVPNATTTSANDLSVTASIPYSGSSQRAEATTSEVVNAISNPTTLHTINFVNQCGQDIWYAFQNGAGGTGPTRKSPDPTGQQAFDFYELNTQLTGAAPDTKTISFNEYVNGAIVARTGCDTSTGICATASCTVSPGTGTCIVGNDPTPPMTIFEANLDGATASDGSYDVSMVNGFNVPGEVRSLYPTVTPLNFTNACGQSAGAVIQPTGSPLGQCSWSFTPPNSSDPGNPDRTANFIFVSAGAQDSCSPACTGNTYCGTAFNSAPNNAPINRRCGTFQGYWAVADYVGYTSTSQWGTGFDLYTNYNLGGSLSSSTYGAGALISNLFSCTETANGSLLSGYSHTLNVCGCYDWNQPGSVAPTAQASNCIVPSTQNPDWLSNVFGRISWLKQACPTAYSYQFDDTSSSFTCNVAGKKTSYQITFCPGGKTGQPGT